MVIRVKEFDGLLGVGETDAQTFAVHNLTKMLNPFNFDAIQRTVRALGITQVFQAIKLSDKLDKIERFGFGRTLADIDDGNVPTVDFQVLRKKRAGFV